MPNHIMALRVHSDEFASAMGLWMIAEAGGMNGTMVPMDNGPGSAADGEKTVEKKAPKKEGFAVGTVVRMALSSYTRNARFRIARS